MGLDRSKRPNGGGALQPAFFHVEMYMLLFVFQLTEHSADCSRRAQGMILSYESSLMFVFDG